MKFDLVLERKTINKLNPETTRKTIKHIAKSAERNRSLGFVAKVGRLNEPLVVADESDGVDKYRYLVRIRLLDPKSRCMETSREKFQHLLKVVQKCANSRSWAVLDDNASTEAAPTCSGPAAEPSLAARPVEPRAMFEAPTLNEEAMNSFFCDIYERDEHIRLIHDSTEAFVESGRSRRSHTILWGKPASCKTTIFEAFKLWYEQGSKIERVRIMDATTMTKAGLERWILDQAEAGTLPEILCLEEIEKHQPENLLSLLGVMDSRGQLQRTNANVGHIKEQTHMLVWATCNDQELLKAFKNGALWSRFTHQHECLRPTRELMHKILLREVRKIHNSNPLWADKALEFGFDVMNTDDPRAIIGLLDGRNRLLTGDYQRDKVKAMCLDKKRVG